MKYLLCLLLTGCATNKYQKAEEKCHALLERSGMPMQWELDDLRLNENTYWLDYGRWIGYVQGCMDYGVE